MKKYCKIVLTVATALTLCIAMVGCEEKSPDEITEKDFEKAAADLDKEYVEKKDSATERKEINPFENLKVTFGGISPNSTINMTGGSSQVTYTAHIEGSDGLSTTASFSNGYSGLFTNSIKGMKNGDVVTIVAEIESSYYAEKYTLKQTESEYTVEGLSAYAKKLAEIPQETADKMEQTFRDAYTAYMTKHGSKPTLNNMELLGNYMLYPKEGGVTSGSNNYIYFVYKVSADFPDLGTKEYYWCAYYSNVLILPDGTISADYEDLNMGLMNYFTANGFNIDGCDDLDTLFSKNITSKIDKYDYETTVK